MLKFSGFANLTSCLEAEGARPKAESEERHQHRDAQQPLEVEMFSALTLDAVPCQPDASRAPTRAS
jgi:hypothetical protein